MDDDNQSGDPLDVEEWLRKLPRVTKAVQEDAKVAQQSVDQKVHRLRKRIGLRIARIECAMGKITEATLESEALRRNLLDKEKEIEVHRMRASKLSDENKEDKAQIDAIKSSHEKAQSRLQKVEEAIQALKSVAPEPKADGPAAGKRPHQDEPAHESVQKRQRPEQTLKKTSFWDVHNNGRPFHEVVEFPSESGKYFILECTEHKKKFGCLAWAHALNHSQKEHKSSLFQHPNSMFDLFGILVENCRPDQAALINKLCAEREAERKAAQPGRAT